MRGGGEDRTPELHSSQGDCGLEQKAEPACGGNWSDLFLLTWAWGRAGLAALWRD